MVKNEQKDKSVFSESLDEFAAFVTFLFGSATEYSKETTAKILMYIKDFSIFKGTSFTDLYDETILSLSDNLYFEIVTDDDPNETITGTFFGTLLNEKPDHVTIKRILDKPGVVHFIISDWQSLTEMSCTENSWIYSVDDTEACDLMKLNHMALMDEAEKSDTLSLENEALTNISINQTKPKC